MDTHVDTHHLAKIHFFDLNFGDAFQVHSVFTSIVVDPCL